MVADAQTRGRGRLGRTWHTTKGKGLAMSLLLRPRCEAGRLGLLPLVSGLALADGLERLGSRADLKWPNDLLMGDRKVAGILCESRGGDVGTVERAAVVGIGVNVSQEGRDFPPGLEANASSLALEGLASERETVAAEFLNAFEPLWTECVTVGPHSALARWRERASFWGRTVRIQTPSGVVSGVMRDLDPEGRLVVERPDGERVAILAGDLDPIAMSEPLDP